jgi:hypothetical protein
VVEQAAGRGDDDVDAALELHGLRAEAHAAEDAARAEAQVLAVGADDASTCAASSRVGARSSARTGASRRGARAAWARQPLQHRQHEAGGLAGAGLGAGEQSPPASTAGMAWAWMGVGWV